MKKILLPFLFLAAVFMFVSCDDSLPEVTEAEAMEALVAYEMATTVAISSLMNEESVPGITITESGSSGTITFTSVDLTEAFADFGLTSVYTSVSGTYTVVDTETVSTLTVDMTFAGGPVVTLYIYINFLTEEIIIEVNGHDMTAALDYGEI
ncbi:MAG: hypothetical protein JEY91_19035 [Spirochaetaceae bacterium]|nr:hypothetical protein [Spirochaetaceae bacterium]